MDNPCWSWDTQEGTAAHQCPGLEQRRGGEGQQKPLIIEQQKWLSTQGQKETITHAISTFYPACHLSTGILMDRA